MIDQIFENPIFKKYTYSKKNPEITYLKYDSNTNTFSTYVDNDTPLKVYFKSHYDSKEKMMELILKKISSENKKQKDYETLLEKPFRVYRAHEAEIVKNLKLELILEDTSFKRFLKNKKQIISSEIYNTYKNKYITYLKDSVETITTLENKMQEVNKINYIEGWFKSFKEAEEAGAISTSLLSSTLYCDYILYSNLNQEAFKILKKPKDPLQTGNFKLEYNGNDDNSTFRKIKELYSHNPEKPSSDSFKIAKLLKGLTFGFEIETNSGILDHHSKLGYYGLVPLKDGSVGGYEYATVPLGIKDNKPDTYTLAKDLKVFYEGAKELSKVAKVGNNCSFHVHIGGTRKDKAFMLAFYKLCLMLQNEMFLTQPLFKLDSPKYLGLKKNYCKKLPKLNFNYDFKTKNKDIFKDSVHLAYNELFKFLSNGEPLSKEYNRKCKVHPKGKKWDRTERYNWINMVNTIFNNEETIEFRLHSGTLNPDKMINWILLCAAMIKFAENNVYKILKNEITVITIETLLRSYATDFKPKKKINPVGVEVADYLIWYFEDRKKYFKTHNTNWEIEFNEDLTNITPGIKIK